MTLHAAIARIQGTFAARIRKGIEVGGITLRADDADRSAFAQLLVMLGEAERAGALPAQVVIADREGATHALTPATVRSLLAQYGMIYHSLWLQRVNLENAVKGAQDDEARGQIPILFTTPPTPEPA
jgi:hypothetical protein